jgi:hypothetical protein
MRDPATASPSTATWAPPPAFEEAVADFAETYVDVNVSDHGLLAAAAATGRVPVAAG